MMKVKKQLAHERITGTEATRYGFRPGRRVKDDTGGLWVIARMDRVDDADAFNVYMVRWSPLMKPMTSDEADRLLKSRRS